MAVHELGGSKTTKSDYPDEMGRRDLACTCRSLSDGPVTAMQKWRGRGRGRLGRSFLNMGETIIKFTGHSPLKPVSYVHNNNNNIVVCIVARLGISALRSSNIFYGD